MGLSWWWNPVVPMIGPGFSETRAAVVHRAGLKYYRDAWRHGKFMLPPKAQYGFGLLDEEFGAWLAPITKAKQAWRLLVQ